MINPPQLKKTSWSQFYLSAEQERKLIAPNLTATMQGNRVGIGWDLAKIPDSVNHKPARIQSVTKKIVRKVL